jgi:DNA-binding response OmpR family regulator
MATLTPRPTRGPDFGPKGKVLIVDGDCAGVEACCAFLLQQGYETRCFKSYEEAVHCLGSESFDFVMVCQGSPAFEGRTVLERVVELDRRTPILVLTRCPNMSCYLEAMQLGAVDYLEKPVALPEILRMVETHLRSRRVPAQGPAELRRSAPSFRGTEPRSGS